MRFRRLLPLCILFVAHSVRAAEPGDFSATAPADHAQRRWYGWQTALADVAALGVGGTVAGLGGGTGGGVIVVGGYALGGPVVHAAHGQWANAGLSLGLRLGAPVIGALGGYLVGYVSCARPDRSDVPCSAVGGGLGLLAGAATAVILDAAVVAYEPEREVAPSVSIVPMVIAERNLWGGGVSGSF